MYIDCPPKEQLQRWVLGKLSDADADFVFEHLGDCEDCDSHVSEFSLDQLHFPLEADAKNRYSQEPECRNVIEALANNRHSISPKPSNDFPISIRDYEFKEELGRGGIGVVYRARHHRLNKEVAIKLLSDQAVAHSQTVRRFQREMSTVGTLDHPNVVRAFDAGELDGRQFLVMELLDGMDLAKLVASTERLSIEDSCELARQAAIGLQYAHENGLVHRDIKPANLMLTCNSLGQHVVKVMDLGLALATEGVTSQLTDRGQLMGTLGYMAPEQATNVGEVTARADVYSLGSTLFRMLTGVLPYSGENYRTAVQRLNGLLFDKTPSVASYRNDLPSELVRLVDQMLDREPQNRPASMIEVASRLAPFCDGHGLAGVLEVASGINSRSAPPVFLSPFNTDQPTLAPTRVAEKSKSRKPPTRRRLLAALSILLISFSGIIWLRMTDGSYLRVQTDQSIDLDVERLKDGKHVKTLHVGKQKNEFWIDSGKYRIRLPANAVDSLELDKSYVTVSRNSKPVVTIRRVRASAKPAIKQPWDEQPIYPTAPRRYDLGFDPQLEDGPDGEGSGSNGWVGSDTDDVTGPSQLFTMLIGRGDLNAELFAGWKNGTGDESSLEFIRTRKTFEPLTDADSFSFTFNIEKYLQAENWGQITIGLANEKTNLFGVSLMGHSNHILKYGVSDWSVFPRTNKQEGITHGYALQSDRLNAEGKESVELTYDGQGKVRVRVFSDPNSQGSTRYDSGFVPITTAKDSGLDKFSADRLFIANDQAAGDKKRRIWLRIDDIRLRSDGAERMSINFDQ